MSAAHVVFVAGIAIMGGAVAAEPAAVPDPPRGGTRIDPPGNVDPRYLPSGPNAEPAPVEPPGASPLALRLTLDYPLRTGEPEPLGLRNEGAPPVSPTVQAAFRWQPVKDSYWFVHATLYRYLQPERQQPWNPDFTYGFGYDDWHPGTFSFTYGNYSGNRFSPDRGQGERRWNFGNGQWSLGYKFALPQAWQPLFLIDEDDQVTCNLNLNLTPRYTDLASLSVRRNKKSVSAGCRYSRASGWYANLTLFAYPDRSQQQPWDPDFTYGFGYFNWRPGTVSLQYNNYSGNRLPGRERAATQGRLRNGSISLSWSLPW